MKHEIKYSIGDVARETELSTRTIRYYEEIGLLDHPKRKGNRRYYDDGEVRRLKFIKRLKVLGLSLAEMAELNNIFKIHRSNERVLERLLELLANHAKKIDSKIILLTQLRDEIEAYRERVRQKLNGD